MSAKLLKLAFIVLLTITLPAMNAFAAEPATKAEAVAFVKKAIAYVKANGKEKALAEFHNKDSQFFDREMYIVALDLNGNLLANGINPRMVGKNLIDFRDVNGKYFVREEIEVIKDKGKGWVDFVYNNPVSQKIEPRSVYMERIDDYYVLTGVYNKQ